MTASDHLGNQFHLVSNMKNKPNSQGTLFSASPSQRTPESRQPRGYSPERMRDVGDAVTHGGAKQWNAHNEGTSTIAPPGLQGAQARTLQSIARSTVPLADIARKPSGRIGLAVHTDHNIDVSGGVHNEDGHDAGVYKRPSMNVPYGQIEVRAGTDEATSIHEIGHHVDWMARATPYGTDSEKGKAEGFADKYAAEHARTPGYKQKPHHVPSEPGNWRDNDYQPTFNAAYNQERHGNPHGSLQPSQFGSGKDLPKNHVKEQLPLLHKITSGWGDSEEAKWDYA